MTRITRKLAARRYQREAGRRIVLAAAGGPDMLLHLIAAERFARWAAQDRA